MERLDERRVAQRREHVGLGERALAVDRMPGDIAVDRPRTAFRGRREPRV